MILIILLVGMGGTRNL